MTDGFAVAEAPALARPHCAEGRAPFKGMTGLCYVTQVVELSVHWTAVGPLATTKTRLSAQPNSSGALTRAQTNRKETK